MALAPEPLAAVQVAAQVMVDLVHCMETLQSLLIMQVELKEHAPAVQVATWSVVPEAKEAVLQNVDESQTMQVLAVALQKLDIWHMVLEPLPSVSAQALE